ncbi:hypothetical protein RhiirA4_490262 [Rhizophagus irregularis]|uniref:Uncharacterized protein n=1 Tax=Rhizophagus irregularis TaxID=588596 RepID=A0A2I1HM91_9GLOM|nr:hypothetical protein RhiirA4_516978 [Rhizophagus irregularis]PKY62893.1 hypothetical protein RhiirA4_490262 [Rhizophagus irregularis]
MDTTIENNDDEMTTWVNTKTREDIQAFYNNFENIYDDYLVKVMQFKTTNDYVELEKTITKPDALLKPGKIPIRLHKPETKVNPAVFFVAVFLIKKAGEALRGIIEETLYSVKIAEKDYERIKIENEEVLAGCAAMTKRINDMEKEKGDKDLTSGLMIADLENRIRNLEADVTAKERIILEKNETINSLWEKINAQDRESSYINVRYDKYGCR